MYQAPESLASSSSAFTWRGFGLRLWLLLAAVMAVMLERQLPADEQGLAVILGFSVVFAMQFALPVALYTYLVIVSASLLDRLGLSVKLVVQLSIIGVYVWLWYTYHDRFSGVIAYTAPRMLLLGVIAGIYTSYHVWKHHYRHL